MEWQRLLHGSALKVNFCAECGMLLPSPDLGYNNITCGVCGLEINISDFNKASVTFSDQTDAYKKSKKKKNAKEEGLDKTRATIAEPCAFCGHELLYYHTAQLRSADEGQTVFYECVKCSKGKKRLEISRKLGL